ncbi:MAG: LacI family DNA-binding transcriptional regulator [Pseudomonadota bacterium]
MSARNAKSRVTMRDVAREAGVSPMTVSRALNEHGFVNPKTRQTVRQVADRLGYVYDTTAQAFRAQRSGFLAVTLPSIDNANFAATHRALTASMAEAGLQVLLGVTTYRLEEEERLVRHLLTRRPEAMVLTGGAHTEATRSLVTALDIPIVEIWDMPPAPIGHAVGFSNADSMWPIVEHLAETGRRRLLFLGAAGRTDQRGAERRRGAIEAARALGLPEMAILEIGQAPISMTEGMRAADTLGGGLASYDALVCVSDPVAFGALSACERLGIDVPGELAITGFGAFEIASVCVPSITTVDVGAERIGAEAGRLISGLLRDDRQKLETERIDSGYQLIIGATTQG